jgi:hypothetical protein
VDEGLFDSLSRAEAVAACLPLLATYFVSGESWELEARPALAPDDDQLDRQLAQAVRLRVLLALGRELKPILSAIADKPSFEYGRRADESVGVVGGQLDLPRYVRGRGDLTAPRRYPIRIVERQVGTPENLLAVGALHGLMAALYDAPLHLLPSTGGPERRELGELRAELGRIATLPVFARLRAEGERLARQARLVHLRHRVERRLDRREIAHTEAYRELVAWIDHFLAGTCTNPGDEMWAFYDNRFDARLFEIWSLALLAAALGRRYGTPTEGSIKPLWQRDGTPRATWATQFGTIELFFQRDASALGLKPRWRLRARQHRLGAFPDITVRLSTVDMQQWFLVDAKLRRHTALPAGPDSKLDLPSEEIYKMLGYFEHLAPGPYPFGALVYYTPGTCRSARLERDGEGPNQATATGELLLAGLDPGDTEGSKTTFDVLAEMTGERLGEPGKVASRDARELALAAAAAGADALEVAAVGKGRLFRDVAESYANRHPRERETVASTVRASFPESVWDKLAADTQLMLVSAEMYAINQPNEMDFSGPLLVLCAAAEAELNARFFRPLAEMHETRTDAQGQALVAAHPTLGQALYALRHATALATARERRRDEEVTKIRETAESESDVTRWELVGESLDALNVDLPRLRKLLDRLAALNKRYRRRAAHDNPVSREAWVLGRGLLLGPEQLVSEIVSTLSGGEQQAS